MRTTTTVREDTRVRHRSEVAARRMGTIVTSPSSLVDAFRVRAVELMRAEAEDARAAGDYFAANAIDRVAALVLALSVLPPDAPQARAARAAAAARRTAGSGSVVAESDRR